MKVYYALYDQSYDNNAQYWTWFPGEITQQMRDAIASKSGAFQMRPKHPNLLTEPDIVGGIINYQDQWCVVYRFFNGGNDPQGRPDRCVLATAWVRTAEAKGQNLFALLFCPVFQDVQKQALFQCPVQAPKALVENLNSPVSRSDPQFVIYNNNPNIESWSFRSPDEVEVVGKLFPNLIGDGLKSLQVLQSASYMETFSGTPLASGITYVSKAVIQPEPENGYNDFADSQSSGWFRVIAFFMLLAFFACASLLTYFYCPQIVKRFIPLKFIEKTQTEPSDVQNPKVQNLKVQKPKVQNPEVQNPEGQNPEGQNPEGQNPEGQNPEGQNPEGQNPEGQNPEGQNPEEQNPEGQNPEGQNPEVQNPEGQLPNTQVPNTQVPNTQVPNTQVPNTPVPNTPVPNTPVPNTQVPNTQVPNTPVPNTPVPNTPVPNTQVPNTPVPNTPVPNTPVPNTPVSNGQNLNWQNPNGQESGRPIYPSGQQTVPGNPPTEPNNGMSGTPRYGI